MNDISYECPVCYVIDSNIPTKYKCSECDKVMCDICYERHIIIKTDCVFCRSPLLIAEKTRKEINRELCRKYKVKLVSSVICGCFVWYILVCFFIGWSRHYVPLNTKNSTIYIFNFST